MHSKNLLIPLSILFLLHSVFVATFSLSGFPQDMHSGQFFPYLAEKPIGEDAYYMLTVSWNMASGRGVVYNYDIPVTGVQPLSTILCAIVAKFVQLLGGDKWLFLRSIILITSIFFIILWTYRWINFIKHIITKRKGRCICYRVFGDIV